MFTYPALLWFLPVLGAVVLIHLINLRRHRRLRWAAMEFLLASYKRSRTRILLQQLLLLLLRTAAVAAVILMFADLKISDIGNGSWTIWFGEKPLHHIVLLDESYSMNDRDPAAPDKTVFTEGLNVIQKLISDKPSLSKNSLSILTQTKKMKVGSGELKADGSQLSILNSQLSTSSSADPADLLTAAIEAVKETPPQYRSVVYFLSDFRQRNWLDTSIYVKQIETLRKLGAAVRAVRLTDTEHTNWTVEKLELTDGIHAAEIEMLADVSIRRYERESASPVTAELYVDNKLQSQYQLPADNRQETITARVPFRVPGKGRHTVELRIPADAVPNDNSRILTVQVPDVVNVLIVASPNDALYVRNALSPAGVRSGIRTRTEPAAYLSRPETLKDIQVVYLLVSNIEPAGTKALEQFVQNGGGIAAFADNNGIWRGSAALRAEELSPDLLTRQPDIQQSEHPAFRLFNGENKTLLDNIKIDKHLTYERETVFPSAQPVLTLRNGSPLVLEDKIGEGRVLSFLTTATPDWNNWGRGNPSYVVMLLELTAYLAKEEPPALPEENNVDPAEGDIRIADIAAVKSALEPIHQPVEDVNDFLMGRQGIAPDTFSSADYMLLAFILLLIGETFLAGRIAPPLAATGM